MKRITPPIYVTAASCLIAAIPHAQLADSLANRPVNFPSRFFNKRQEDTACLDRAGPGKHKNMYGDAM